MLATAPVSSTRRLLPLKAKARELVEVPVRVRAREWARGTAPASVQARAAEPAADHSGRAPESHRRNSSRRSNPTTPKTLVDVASLET
jgi:hypothetical protein